MNKIFFASVVVMFSAFSLMSAPLQYEYQHQFALKKDEIGSVWINRKEVTKKPTAKNPNNEYLLKVRWTLFTNNMLTLLVNYRGYSTQYVLEKKYPLSSIMIPLLPDGENKMVVQTYARIVFADFDQRNREGILDIFIEDNAQRIEVEFRPKKKP